MNEKVYALWFASVCGAGSAAADKAVTAFSSFKEIYEAPAEKLKEAGISERSPLYSADKDLTSFENAVITCAEKDIKIVSCFDADFPSRLKNIRPAPAVLFVKGNLPRENSLSIAAVGTRKSTRYGEKVSYKICRLLSESGVTVISGMAKGNDGFALMGALDGGVPPFAVLGTGVDVVYPKENKDIYDAILAAGGGIISECFPGAAPFPANFPKRNRIMAGLANGVLVTEAPKSSGALITAHYALEYGKDVFAVPGSLFSRESDGVNMLIRDGKAKPVLNHLDILEEYSGLFDFVPTENKDAPAPAEREEKKEKKKKKAAFEAKAGTKKEDLCDPAPFLPPETGDEKSDRVLSLLASRPMHPSEIAELSGIPAPEVSAMMTVLELDGRIAPEAGGYFKRLV